MAARDDSGSAPQRHDDEVSVKVLTDQVSFLEEEIAALRRKLADSPRTPGWPRGQRSPRLQASLAAVTGQNERLAATLREARDQIIALKEEVDRLAQPPAGFGVFLQPERRRHGRRLHRRPQAAGQRQPGVELDELRAARRSCSTRRSTWSSALELRAVGEIVMLKEILEDGERALVIAHADEERVVRLAEPLLGQHAARRRLAAARAPLRLRLRADPQVRGRGARPRRGPGHRLRADRRPGRQIEQIRDAVELPYLHPDLFREHELRPPKGVLLYGPPGCGKTLIAKAVANSLAKKVAEVTGQPTGKSYFLNIKGPELLNKYVGETERHIRLVFQRAREKASEGTPVIVFFDEMDSLFRTRGSGVSSDVENTIVPQLLSEIDGVEGLENVIVIGASNREDMIDPAILRPGRLDVKIKIERPDAEAARDIFSKYLTADLPLHADDLAEHGGAARPTVAGDDPAHRRADVHRDPRRTASSRSPTPTATRKSCTSRTSTPAR